MSYYEILVIFSTNLADEDEKAQTSQIEELIKHENGTIHLVEHWGKRKLAYPIKKQRQGYYEWLYVELDPGRTAEIDRKLKMSETILRFLIFKMEKIQIQNLQRELERRKDAAAAASAQAEQVPVSAPVEQAASAEPAATAEETPETVQVTQPAELVTEQPEQTEEPETAAQTEAEPSQEG